MSKHKLTTIEALDPAVGVIYTPSTEKKTLIPRRSIADFLAPLENITKHSPSLISYHDAHFKHGAETYELPRYIFVGPQGGDTPIHVGIFAGLHGDRLEGVQAVVQFIKVLEAEPELARGYCLSFYPICNPTGFEDGTRFSRSGKDLNREFWKNSSEPEVWLLQAELLSRSFQGIITLHTNDGSDHFHDCPVNVTLAEHILRGRAAENAGGTLSAPPKARPRPFEIVFKTAATLPSYINELGFISALQMTLIEYREFIAHAPNL